MSKHLPRIIGSVVNFISYFSTSFAATLAMKIFSLPKKGKVKGNESKFLDSSIQETILFQDNSIMTYRWAGSKETILLAHGWESNSFRWKRLIEILKPLNYNIIALDAPAHGNSGSKLFTGILYSEWIHVVAKKFDVNVIIGHSMGGMSAILAQQKYKLTTLNKIVLLGAPSNFVGLFNRYISMMRYNKKVSQGMSQYCLKHYNQLPEYFSAVNFFKDIKIKGLIIHDKGDPIIPFRDALDIKRYYQNSELIKTNGYGHSLKSSTVYSYITNFLKA